MKKLLLILALVMAPVLATAQTFAETQTSQVQVPGGQPAVAAIGVTGPGTPVVVQPQAPVPYDFSAGTALASLVNWIWVAFGGVVTGFAVKGVLAVMKWLGVQSTQQMNDRLVEAVSNGLNDAASKVQADLNGKFSIEVKNKVIADAIEYAKAHQADTIKALGLDPNSGEVTAALKAKAESIIVDPSIATNPALVPNAGPTPAKA